jgi:Phasin protein/Hemerythrin HHE cation binding domain
MTTIRQLIQTSPVRANELFAKLVDTSENAVKTREKLFADLKEELELLASLEEQHLFPVLRKHKDLKDLVREALNDNKATRKLLTELDHTPKDGEEFATRVAELRRVFQQHVRDDKKELVPAVLKALSDEEAEAVVERIETEKAEIEEAKRAEAEERRAEARREREKVEAEQARIEAVQRAEAEERRAAARQEREDAKRVQQAAETVVNTAWAAPRTARQAATAAQELAQSGVSTAVEVAQRTTDQVTEVFGAARQRTQDLTERAMQNLKAVTQSSAILARGIQEASGECLEMVQERVQKNLDGVNALARCRSLPEFLAAQSSLLRDNLELTLTNSRRIAELSAQVASTATQTATAETGRSANRAG